VSHASMPPALVTYGWCRVAYVIAHSLHGHGIEVHATDAAPLAMCRFSRAVSSFQRTRDPWSDPAGFSDDIGDAARRHRVGVVLPGHDDVGALLRHRDRLPGTTMLVAPSLASLDVAGSKAKTATLARQLGIDVPVTFEPTTDAELEAVASRVVYPAVVKPRISNSAKGFRRVESPGGLIDAHRQLVQRYRLSSAAWPLVQQFVEGRVVGVCALYCEGRPRAWFCERYLRVKDDRYGTSVLRESFHDDALVERAQRFLDALQWHGVAHLDFIVPDDGTQPVLLECNPRFWGALDLAVRSGVDMPWLLYRLAIDGDVDPVTDYRDGVVSRWAVGELSWIAHRLVRREIRSTWTDLRATHADGYDDVRRGDLRPFAAELLHYAVAAARGGANPTQPGMIG
jgi:predicted ATP-grasp superfamily ATP-dependent carboligase